MVEHTLSVTLDYRLWARPRPVRLSNASMKGLNRLTYRLLNRGLCQMLLGL
jgi:hypothetical protein